MAGGGMDSGPAVAGGGWPSGSDQSGWVKCRADFSMPILAPILCSGAYQGDINLAHRLGRLSATVPISGEFGIKFSGEFNGESNIKFSINFGPDPASHRLRIHREVGLRIEVMPA